TNVTAGPSAAITKSAAVTSAAIRITVAFIFSPPVDEFPPTGSLSLSETAQGGSKRAKERNKISAISIRQRPELLYDARCLSGMSLDRVFVGGCTTVMKQRPAETQPPERRSPNLISPGCLLLDSVASAHIVQ